MKCPVLGCTMQIDGYVKLICDKDKKRLTPQEKTEVKQRHFENALTRLAIEDGYLVAAPPKGRVVLNNADKAPR